MRATSIAVVSAVTLIAASALAQAQTAPPGAMGRPIGTPPAGGAPAAPAVPKVDPLTLPDVSNITGTPVYGSDDQRIGKISTELMNPKSKQIDRFVVSVGGVLGVGAHDVALPIDAFKWDSSKNAFTISDTTEQLKSMPAYREEAAEAPSLAPSSSVPLSSPHGTTQQ